MINLTPERQAEYRSYGLPWLCNQSDGIYCITGKHEDEIRLFEPLTDSVEVLEFATLAANEHHQLKHTVERLRGVLAYALSHEPCDETDSVMEKALAETEASHD
jgi:hypothetical protein